MYNPFAGSADSDFVPRIGAYTQLSDLAEARDAGTAPSELEGGLARGLALELDLPASDLNIQSTLNYVTETNVSGAGFTSSDDGGRLLAVTGDLVFRPLPRIVLLQPYPLGGAGVKVYDFGLDQIGDSSYFENRTDFALHAAASTSASAPWRSSLRSATTSAGPSRPSPATARCSTTSS